MLSMPLNNSVVQKSMTASHHPWLFQHAQNIYLGRIILFAIGLILLFALLSCNNRHDLTENYAVFTYGEGLYGESKEDYPVFVSKLGYKDDPTFIANVRFVRWNDSTIIIQ